MLVCNHKRSLATNKKKKKKLEITAFGTTGYSKNNIKADCAALYPNSASIFLHSPPLDFYPPTPIPHTSISSLTLQITPNSSNVLTHPTIPHTSLSSTATLQITPKPSNVLTHPTIPHEHTSFF
jgi:hypothetical protein